MKVSAAKRIGRPMNAPPKGKQGKRVSLGLKVTAEMKRQVDAAALLSGRTQSQEAEMLMEDAVKYRTVLAAMNMTMEQIAKGKIDAAFRAAGYTAVHSTHGNVWVPPGYPIERSGFIDQEDKS